MASEWNSCIQKELDDVESLMRDSIKTDNKQLLEMCDYVIGTHGKRIRSAVCILSYCACDGKNVDKAISIGAALEIIHNATLIHDDINDEAELRRGRKALYKEYSLSKSIIAGDYMYAIGFRLIGSISLDIVDIIVDAASCMGAGEFDQRDFEHKGIVTEEDYMRIVNGKTAKLIGAASRCGSFTAGANMTTIDAMSEYANNIGMAFQIVDDVLDIVGNTDNTGKTVGNDVIEGKPTLPIIYGMQDPIYGEEIRKIFESSETTDTDAKIAVDMLKKTDSVSKCMSKAEDLIEEAIENLAVLKDSVYKTALVDLANYIVRRDR